MRKLEIHSVRGPEAKIQAAIIKFLEDRKWMVKSTHGNLYSSGWPDLYACRRRFYYGDKSHPASEALVRWIEVKNPLNYRFTAAQLKDFPRFNAEGIGIWIMTEATEAEYQKLFRAPNWYTYLSAARA